MLIKRKRGWEIPESQATPESVFLNRRELMAAGGAVMASAFLPDFAFAADTDQTLDLYPAKRNEKYVAGRPITDEAANLKYNNYYEFLLGMAGDSSRAAQSLKPRPWQIKIDGMVEKPITMDIDEFIRKMKLEERVYRHRCVERWAMVVPWTGFPMADLVAFAKPNFGARFVRMETFMDPKMASNQNQSIYPWPYVEGLTIAEATSELAFMVTGAYGKPVANVMGAPLRLHTPWKYGFKSVKSIVKFTFTDKRPVSFWEEAQGYEYGFWANVNPQVPHPRWSQASEKMLGTNEVIPTQIYNGYGEFVADLYKDIKGEKLFM